MSFCKEGANIPNKDCTGRDRYIYKYIHLYVYIYTFSQIKQIGTCSYQSKGKC